MEGVMSFAGQIYPDDTVGYFRIASSTGRQPIEPIAIGQFLIGSGADCHLRFGNAGLADVHCILNVEADSVLLTTKSSQPSVLINGVPETECRLNDGDMLEVGKYRMLFRFAAAEQRITLDETEFAEATNAGESTEHSRAQSVDQLVDRLQEQLDLVEELSHSPDDAMVDLLKAVAEAGKEESLQKATSVAAPASDLQQVTALIQKHHEASRIRLESLTEVLDNVVRQQKLIADTLEVLSDRVQSATADTDFQHRRASA